MSRLLLLRDGEAGGDPVADGFFDELGLDHVIAEFLGGGDLEICGWDVFAAGWADFEVCDDFLNAGRCRL